MLFIQDLGLGFRTFFRAIGFISKHKLSGYYIFPVLLSVLLFWGSSVLKQNAIQGLEGWLYNHLEIDRYLAPDGFWSSAIEFIVYWTMTLAMWVIWFKINRYIVLIVLSPVFSILSERTEKIVTGNHYPFEVKQFITDVLRGMFIAFKNLVIEVGIILICLVANWVFPPLAVLTLPILSLTAWYFMGFSFMDYNFERQKMNQWQSSKTVWNRKGIALSNGMLFTLLTYIPVLGVTFGSLWAVVGASLALNEPPEGNTPTEAF